MPKYGSQKTTNVDLTKKAYNSIRQLMFHNEIIPGQKLAYRDLAKRLDMSPTPIGNALKYLEFQGLVRKELNRGYFTERISLKEVEEIYNFREQLEVSMLREGLPNLGKSHEKKFEKVLEASINITPKTFVSERVSKDIDFHMTLASFSDNQTKLRSLRQLFDLLYLKYGGNVLFNQNMNPEGFDVNIASTESCNMSTVCSHKRIFKNVIERNLKEAKKELSNHILSVKKKGSQRIRADDQR